MIMEHLSTIAREGIGRTVKMTKEPKTLGQAGELKFDILLETHDGVRTARCYRLQGE